MIRHGKAADQLEDTATQCAFGKMKLNVGDELESPDEMKCKCIEPPFVDCIQSS